MKESSIWLTPRARRAAAFAALLGGCITMTIYAGAALWYVREEAKWVFWLGIAAHVQIALGMGVFAAHFIRRTISITKDGLVITDDEYVEITSKSTDGGNQLRVKSNTGGSADGPGIGKEQPDK